MVLPEYLGRYQITEVLGRGAMGVVYKAHDPLIDRAVAIKTISYAGLTPGESHDFEQRFFLEAKSAGRLNHPNIVTIHDVGHSDELAYIAMEFLEGQSLRDIIDSGVVLPASRMARYAYSVADGLAFAHANGVIHRDIKPANIMVLDSGRVKITDFGIALLPSGALTTAGMAVGSPKYMAPEQVLGQKADHRSDIFSLGAVLYELLTGFPPFSGADINAILYQVLNGAPPLPSSLNTSLPPGFDRIVARALSKDPERRYQSAAEMASDLRNYKKLPGLLQAAPTAEVKTEAAKPPAASSASGGGAAQPVPSMKYPRRPGTRAGMAAAALVVALGIGYLWRGLGQSTAPVQVAATNAIHAPLASAQASPDAEQTPKSAPTATPATDRRPIQPVPAQPARSNKRPGSKSKSPASPNAAEPPPSAQQEKPHPPDWRAQLKAKQASCESLSFFSRVVCKEKAAWEFCPGHWGSPECPQGASNQ